MRKKIAVFAFMLCFLFIQAMPVFAAISAPAVTKNPDGSVTITWTGGEPGKNVTIQRGTQGDPAYFGTYSQDIATVPQTDGSYTDKSPGGKAYYRLKTSGMLGAPNYSSVVAPSGDANANKNNQQPTEDQGGLFEQAIAQVINGLYTLFTSVTGAAGFKHIDQLIFPQSKADYSLEKPAPFTDQWNTLDKMYLAIALGTMPLCLIVVVVTAFRFMGAGARNNPQSRMDAMETIWRWFFAIIIIASAPIFIRVLFVLNNSLVEALRGAASSMNAQNYQVLNVDAVKNLHTGTVLGTALVKLYMAVMEFWVNIIFFVRDWVLRVFYIFTPIMAWLWAMNKNVNAAAVWLGEILTNAFLHSAFALTFCVVVLFLGSGSDIPWPAKVVGVSSLVAISGVIRNTLQGLWTKMAGVNEESIGQRALGGIGLGGIAGVGKVASASAGRNGGLAPGNGSAPGGGPNPLQGQPAPSGTGGSPLTPSGTAGGAGAPSGVASSVSGGTLSGSAGVSGSGGTPAGYATTASGLAAPSSAVAGGTAGSAASAPSSPSLSRAINTGRDVGGVFQKTAAVMSAPFNAIPGGQNIQRMVVSGAGVVGRAVGAGGSFAKQTYDQARQMSPNGSIKETIRNIPAASAATVKEMTGESSTARAAVKTSGAMLTDSVSPGMTKHVLPRAANPKDINSFRFR